MVNERSEQPEFGKRERGRKYISRPSAHAVVWNASGLIAVVKTPRGFYLPGGGSEPGEAPEDTVRREALEEAGMMLGSLSWIGTALQNVTTEGHEEGVRKECAFYDAPMESMADCATEPDHTLLWLTAEDAGRTLSYDSQKWAVRLSEASRLTERQAGGAVCAPPDHASS